MGELNSLKGAPNNLSMFETGKARAAQKIAYTHLHDGNGDIVMSLRPTVSCQQNQTGSHNVICCPEAQTRSNELNYRLDESGVWAWRATDSPLKVGLPKGSSLGLLEVWGQIWSLLTWPPLATDTLICFRERMLNPTAHLPPLSLSHTHFLSHT